MSNVFTSSIGKKLIMSVTGLFLVLFLLFHMAMNLTAIISDEAYNAVVKFLGANWYALAGTAVLAAGCVIHLLYATILTLQNRKARGSERYAVTHRPKEVEWASKNMYILGAVILAFILLHLYNFWYRMQFVEVTGIETSMFDPHDGAGLVRDLFSSPVYCLIYLVAFVALWFHINHGFWSALQTLGMNNKVWIVRLQKLSKVVSTLIFLGFAAVVVYFYIQSVCCA